MRGPHQHVVVYFEVLHEDVEHAPRHPLLDLEQGWRAVPQLAQPLIDGLEQVVGLVFLDHHVGVADDAEDVRALDRRAGKSDSTLAHTTSSMNTKAVPPPAKAGGQLA